jgi:hypothetical protein
MPSFAWWTVPKFSHDTSGESGMAVTAEEARHNAEIALTNPRVIAAFVTDQETTFVGLKTTAGAVRWIEVLPGRQD